MKPRLSFRLLIIIMFVGGMLPLQATVGLVVYRLQQSYLLREAERRLTSFVRAGVEAYAGEGDLTVLAVALGETLRPLGADLFVQDADGAPVPPALGTGPWLDRDAHDQIRASRSASLHVIPDGDGSRMVYLAAVVDSGGNILGTTEASLSLDVITDELAALRRWLVLITALASALSVLVAIPLSALVTRPLRDLLESVERAREGALDTRARVPAVLELGQLAITYNALLDRISDELNTRTRMVETMRQFAADASHELRSPLSVFRNSVELLDRARHQDDQEQFPGILALLRSEVDTMTGLVENLLLLARLEQPDEAVAELLHLEDVDPFPLLEEIYERSLLLAQGQEIALVWPKGEVPVIRADREMLRRALNNVVENALAYTPAGKKITLSVECRVEGCCFLVEDEGSGIASDQLPRIFERFYRSDQARSRRVPGTGLGLAIVAAIVRAHGGTADVESQLGRGTRIRLSLPVAAPRP